MAYRKLSDRIKTGPEDCECLAFVTELRVATLEGRLRAVWTHPANELAGMVRKSPRGGVAVPPQVALARALGLITGTSDYLFLWDSGALAMEFKAGSNRLTDGQSDFSEWCALMGVPFHLVRSAAAGLEVLRNAGRLV
ncbi:hypothetical protein GTZ99_12370 [Novosphingobium sp. FSY-8]|uniref:VRR-NUC domain-containing protein n=1 Tax=Novosphingobium ovatum TaxID=1908523 RepID=A0ABW9XFM5_9SPHN|nr:hypothetical protein [Novosphingobium ovatum]NBC37345.1 hypothetical protein [Novosphingobium ovatum]